MNCSTTPDVGHICKHDLKMDQSQVRQIRQIRQNSSTCLLKFFFGKPQMSYTHPINLVEKDSSFLCTSNGISMDDFPILIPWLICWLSNVPLV